MATIIDIKEASIVRPKTVFIDANFLIYWFKRNSKWHKTCKDLVKRLSQRGTKFVISTRVIDEFIWKIVDMEMQTLYGREWLSVYKKGELQISSLKELLEGANNFIQALKNTKIVPVCAECIKLLTSEMVLNNFLPADALHLLVMKREKINTILTLDKDFRNYPESLVVICNKDLRPPVVVRNASRG